MQAEEFLVKNKIALLQELRDTLSMLQSLVSDKLPAVMAENEESTPPNLTETYMDISISVGYMVGLFNELQSIEYGMEDIEEPQENPIGFGAMLNKER